MCVIGRASRSEGGQSAVFYGTEEAFGIMPFPETVE